MILQAVASVVLGRGDSVTGKTFTAPVIVQAREMDDTHSWEISRSKFSKAGIEFRGLGVNQKARATYLGEVSNCWFSDTAGYAVLADQHAFGPVGVWGVTFSRLVFDRCRGAIKLDCGTGSNNNAFRDIVVRNSPRDFQGPHVWLSGVEGSTGSNWDFEWLSGEALRWDGGGTITIDMLRVEGWRPGQKPLIRSSNRGGIRIRQLVVSVDPAYLFAAGEKVDLIRLSAGGSCTVEFAQIGMPASRLTDSTLKALATTKTEFGL